MEIAANGFIFSDDRNRIDISAVHHFLSTQSYWAKDIPYETVKRAIAESLCFGIYKGSRQIGFARWITDKATFAYLADVYTETAYQRKGLMRKLISLMLFHPELQGLRRYQLSTRDAHDLYADFGFSPLTHPERQMAIDNSGSL